MARSGLVVKKMNKRKRGGAWGSNAKKRFKTEESQYRARLTLIRRPDFGFPDKMTSRLRYSDIITLTGGGINNYTWRLNSLNDPDLSGIGHQPMYFDQYCGASGTAPYSRYRVLGSKIKVLFTSGNVPALAVNNYYPALVGLLPEVTSSLTAGSASGLMETSNANWAILQDKSGGNNQKTLTVTYSPVRDLGLDQGDDTISAPYNGNPASGFFCHMFKVDQGTAGSVVCYVEIEYFVEFYQRNEVSQS